jgi:hypothetical protein
MIWRTSLGRWHDRYGHWHRWFAWHPVSLENPNGEHKLDRAWLQHVARIGVIVRGRQFWLYCAREHVGLDSLPPRADNVVSLKSARHAGGRTE